MKDDQSDDELLELRRALLHGKGAQTPASAAPSSATVWQAAQGELPPGRMEEILDRVVADPELARQWSLARALASPQRRPARRPSWPRMLWPAAALALTAAGLSLWLAARPASREVYRGEPGRIESLLPDGSALRAGSATLRWECRPPAPRYVLRLMTAELEVLLVKEGIVSSSFDLPAAAIEGRRTGEELLWQVEALYDDGTRTLSPTFGAVVGAPAGGG
ncbi:MAG TPA: hypothetical protein VJV23_07360 [Candidatus Polarisedimenticolia bacterium]|nr:hypothetical protein [Candidatus Polarisedimenticolia bacterium]